MAEDNDKLSKKMKAISKDFQHKRLQLMQDTSFAPYYRSLWYTQVSKQKTQDVILSYDGVCPGCFLSLDETQKAMHVKRVCYRLKKIRNYVQKEIFRCPFCNFKLTRKFREDSTTLNRPSVTATPNASLIQTPSSTKQVSFTPGSNISRFTNPKSSNRSKTKLKGKELQRMMTDGSQQSSKISLDDFLNMM